MAAPRLAPRIVACHGKEQMSAARAATGAGQMRRRHHDGTITAYRCGHCGMWHVGNHLIKEIRRPARRLEEVDDGT